MFAYLCSFFISENKNRIYIENKMGKIGDPCGIPVRIARAACFFPLNANSIFRSIMNDWTHRINWFGIFNFYKMSINRSVETWLNAPFTSRNRHEKTFFEFFAVWISCNRHRDASIADRFFLPPICSLCNKFECSAKCDNRVAMIFSDIFLKQFNNIIIRYALDCE